MRFNGKDAPVAGVSMVGTLPVYRKMGCLRKANERHFKLLHEEKGRSASCLRHRQPFTSVTVMLLFPHKTHMILTLMISNSGRTNRSTPKEN